MRFVFLLFALSFGLGCKTPDSVRAVSQEQLKVIKATADAHKAYFAVMEKFANAVSESAKAEARRDWNSRKVLINRKHRPAPNATPGEIESNTNALAIELEQQQAAFEEEIKTIEARVALIRQKQNELLSYWADLQNAQNALDKYIATKNTDEFLYDLMLRTFNVNRDKLETEGNQVLGKLEAIINK